MSRFASALANCSQSEGCMQPLTGLAIGYTRTPTEIPEEYAQRDERPRERKSLQDILIEGGP